MNSDLVVSFPKGRGRRQNLGLSQMMPQLSQALVARPRHSSGETQARTGRHPTCSHITAGDIAKSHSGVATSFCINGHTSG